MDTKKSTTDKIVSTGLYARISDDETGQGLGVERQLKECAALAAAKGWTVVGTYVDNDVSAYRSKIRPEFARMLADIRAGRLNGVIAWDLDRLTRDNRETEDIIDLVREGSGLHLASVGGEVDLATTQGRLMARIKASVSKHEVEQMSRRWKGKLLDRATHGDPHAPQAYGYRRVIERDANDRKIRSYDVIDPAEHAVLLEAAERILAGQSMRSVVMDFNRRGIPAPRARKDGRQPRWLSHSLRGMLIRERNVGKRIHQGEVIGDAQWEPLWDQDTHDRLVALLTDPARKQPRGRTRRYLLSGIAICGKCSGLMSVNTPHAAKPVAGYVCRDKRDVRRGLAEVDAWVESVMIERLKEPGVLDHLVLGDPQEVETARDTMAAARARMELAADEFAHGRWSAEQVARVNAVAQPQILAAQAVIDSNQPRALPFHIAGPDADKHWAQANLDQKRALIKALVTITILPSGGGRRRFDPALVVIDPVDPA